MIRKLLLPLAALVLLGGCVSTGYSYRGGSGDYYHGRPSVDYRYYPSYYPYGYYGPYRYRHASPWGYRYYYGGYPYGYRHRYVYPRYPGHHERPRTDPTPDRSRSPWRDLDRLRDGNQDGTERQDSRDLRRNDPAAARPPRPAAPRIQAPAPRPAPTPAPARTRSGSGDGSAIGGMLRRTRDRSHKNPRP